MYVKVYTSHIDLNDNRIPPQPAKYNCEIIAEFDSVDIALSFQEDLVRLISQYRMPANLTKNLVDEISSTLQSPEGMYHNDIDTSKVTAWSEK